MIRRLIFLGLALLVILGFVVTKDFTTTAALKWYLHSYAKNNFDSELSYDQFIKENGIWVIDNPRLTKEGEHIFQADKIVLQLDLSPLTRTFNIDIAVTSPIITLGDHYHKAIKMATKHSHRFRIFHINQHISATNGSILYQSTEQIPPLAFTIDTTFGPLSHGTAKITPLYSRDSESKLTAQISQEPNNPINVDLIIERMPIAPLAELFHVYAPSIPFSRIHTGNTSGQMRVTIPKKKLAQIDGDFTIENFYVSKGDYFFKAPKITFTLAPKENQSSLIPFTAHVDILGGASLTLTRNNTSFWSLDHIEGAFSFADEGNTFHLDGISSNTIWHYPLRLEGFLHVSDTQETTLSFKTLLQRNGNPHGNMTANVSLRHLADQWDLGKLEINGFTFEEFNLFKHVLSQKFPKLDHVHLTNGVFDTSLIVYLQDLQPVDIKFDKIQARNVIFSLDNWNFSASAKSVTGTASIDLSAAEPISSLDVDLSIANGTASLPGPRGHPWNFLNIDSNFIVRQGIIQQSSLEGSVAGMTAKMILDGTHPDSLVKLQLIGSTDDLVPYVSKSLKKNLVKHFSHNLVQVEAVGKAIASRLEVQGKIAFSEQMSNDPPILFSFALDRKRDENKDEKPPHYIVSEYLTNASMEAITSLLPSENVEPPPKKKKKVHEDRAWSLFGYTLHQGKFEANDLCIDKYLSPFIFTEDEMNICGIGAFYGIFDIHGLKVDYDASDLVLKNEDFSIEIKKICQQNEFCTQMVASHYFDFDAGKGYGTLPVNGGSYFEKNSGLLFTDINAIIFLQHDRAHVTELSTFCNGIHFGGNIEVDWSMPGKGIFNVDVHIAEMDGKVSQFQHFFSHFNKPFFFLKVPIEGNISLRNKGAHLFFAFVPNDFSIDCNIEGTVTDGVLHSPELDVVINDVGFNFAYDHVTSLMDFSELQATLLVGSPSHFEEYIIASDGIHFSDFNNNESVFDIWVADKSRDIVRVVGKTFGDRNLNDEPIIKVDLDKTLTHFGNVYPKNLELVLDSDTNPVYFNFEFDFTLNSLLNDLQRFSRTGLLFLSRSILKELNGINQAEGALSGLINYQKNLSTLQYKIHGNSILIDDYKMGTFELLGTKRGDLWSIEQLQIDNISLSIDIHKDPDLWNINFLGARLGSSILLGMEGIYLPNEDRLKAKINLCEINLTALKEWPILASYIEKFQISGNIKSNGSLDIVFDRSLPEFGKIDLHAIGSITNGHYDSYAFDNMYDVTFEYNSNNGITVKNVQTVLSSSENQEPRAGFYLQTGNFNHKDNSLIVNNLHFNVPSQQLDWLAGHLENKYSSFFSQQTLSAIKNIKSQGNVQGSVSSSFANGKKAFKINLNNDVYNWANSEYNFVNPALNFDGLSLQFTSIYKHENALLNILVSSQGPDFDRGLLAISENIPQETSQIPSRLTIQWDSGAPQGFSINKVQGHLCGITVDLIKDIEFPLNSHYHHLRGTVSFDLTRATQLMSPEQAAAIISAQLGQGYALHGRFALDKINGTSFGDKLYFQGDLSGTSFTCYGYRMNYMIAQFDYQPNQATLTNVMVSDACGQMSIPSISLVAGMDNRWYANIPLVSIKDLSPSSMVSLTPSTPMQKSLVMRQIEINNLHGFLGDRNSFQGFGKMSFVNPPKKNFQDTIFAIPAEILTRIGLDLGVLTPVKGNIEFELSDSKIYLKKFKDIYSKKKVSKFQLAKTGNPSYIDLDGNIRVQIKMKQYNIVFKLAELFTVTIGGTISKPTYSLQKQPKDDSNG